LKSLSSKHEHIKDRLSKATSIDNLKTVQKVVQDVLDEMQQINFFHERELPYFLDLNKNSQTVFKSLEEKMMMLQQQNKNFQAWFPDAQTWLQIGWK